MFEMNINAENRLKQIIVVATDILSLTKYEIFSHCTLEMFEKLTPPLISAFYRYRVQMNLKDKSVFSNRGTVDKVISVEEDRKTKGPYLIRLCLNSVSLPLISNK